MLQRESPLIHVCSLRIARTFLARSRTTLKTHTSLPLHVGGEGRGDITRQLRASLCLSLFFEKRERDVLLDKFQRDSRRYRDKGHFSSHTLYVVRVTTAPCLEVLCTKCHYFSSTTSPRCNKLLHC